MSRNFFCILAFLWLFSTEKTNAETIDFESVPGVTPVSGFLNFTPVPPASRLSDQLLASHGVRFRSGPGFPDFVALIGLGSGHATSGSVGIGGNNNTPDIRYNVPIIISFFDPSNTSTPAITDFVSIRADLFDDGGPILMEAFDPNGTLIGTDTATDIGGPLLSISASGIHSIRLFDVGGTIAFDDLTFNSLTIVPEPSSVALLLLGVCALGFFRARFTRLY